MINKNKLKNDLLDKLGDFYRFTEYGEYLDIAEVRVIDEIDYFLVQVIAELNYDGLMELAQQLNPVIQKYDEGAYFIAEDSGLLTAWVHKKDLYKDAEYVRPLLITRYTTSSKDLKAQKELLLEYINSNKYSNARKLSEEYIKALRMDKQQLQELLSEIPNMIQEIENECNNIQKLRKLNKFI